MAVHTKYGSPVVLPLVHERLQLLADGSAIAAGEIETSATVDAIDYLIHVQIPIGTAVATGDTVTIYGVESIDGVNWTDGIDPANAPSGPLAEDIRDARLLSVIDAFHTSAEPVTVEATFHVGQYYPSIPPYIGFVFQNDTSGAITSGVSATYVSITVSAS